MKIKKEIKNFLKQFLKQQNNLIVKKATSRTKIDLLYETFMKNECPLNTYFKCKNFKYYPEPDMIEKDCGNCKNMDIQSPTWACSLGFMDYLRYEHLKKDFKILNEI